MFGNPFREFEEDPFFSPFRDHHEKVSRVMRDFGSFGFRDPFDHHRAIDGPRDNVRHRRDGRDGERGREGHGVDRHQRDDLGRGDYRDRRELAPGDMFHNMFSGMRSMMNQTERNFERMSNDPNAYSYHQSSVMSYSNDGRGEPKYYQATTSTQRAPDGVKQTKRAVRDSERGIHKMAVGHHIGDRGHVMERSLDKKTGREERHENFVHMDESERSSFDQEWRDKTQLASSRLREEYKPRPHIGGERPHRPQAHERRALPDSRARPRKEHMVVDGHTMKRDLDKYRKRDLPKTRASGRPSNKHVPRGDL